MPLRLTFAPILPALVAASLAGCHHAPDAVPIVPADTEFAEVLELADDPEAQGALAAALDAQFGSLAAPRYLVPDAWGAEGFDPNRWTQDAADAAFFARVEAGNRVWFASRIAALEEGDFDALEPTLYAEDLWSDWLALRARRPADPDAPLDPAQPAAGSWRDQAIRLFVEYYPSQATTADVFVRRCSHCHGPAGGGDGQMAARQPTRPRDYRHGKFKRTPLANRARPRHADLLRTLHEGIGGTAMPRFEGRFAFSQMASLADHVRYLAIRGETELLTRGDYDPYEGFEPESLRANYEFVVDRWRRSGADLIVVADEEPRPSPERIAHGRHLFLDRDGAACLRCHGEEGHGDGRSAEVRNPETGELEGFTDDWGQPIRPRDLVCTPYRFGTRPVDLFHRIHAGINGTPMPSHAGMVVTEADGSRHPLGEEDIWDLVFFVRSLHRE